MADFRPPSRRRWHLALGFFLRQPEAWVRCGRPSCPLVQVGWRGAPCGPLAAGVLLVRLAARGLARSSRAVEARPPQFFWKRRALFCEASATPRLPVAILVCGAGEVFQRPSLHFSPAPQTPPSGAVSSSSCVELGWSSHPFFGSSCGLPQSADGASLHCVW